MPRHQMSAGALEVDLFSTSTFVLGFVYGPLSLAYNTPMPSIFQTTTTYRPSMFGALIGSLIIMPLVYEIQYSYTHTPKVSQTPLRSLFYEG